MHEASGEHQAPGGHQAGGVTRLLAYRVLPEMAALWLVELVALFLTLHALNLAGPATASGGVADQAISLNRAALMAAVMGIAALGVGLYRSDVCADRRRTIIAALLAAVLGWAILVVVMPLARTGAPTGISPNGGTLPTPADLLAAPAFWLSWLVLTRGALGWAMRQHLFTRRILVLGGGRRATRMIEMIQAHRSRLFEAIGDAAVPGRITPALLRAQRVWAVVIAEEDGARVPREHLLACKVAGVRISDAAEFCERRLGRIDLDSADQNWALYAHGIAANPAVAFLRRAADIGISLVLLVVTFPLMVATAALIRLDSPGPIFYRQRRTGLRGSTFVLFKFRSMRADAEAPGRPVWAAADDPRVTRVGHTIRRLRIDELPQLLNVLRGEMSIIGPRPERPEFVAELSRAIPLYGHRDCVKPGLTGWAQVSFPYGASVDDARQKLSFDLYYIKHRGVLLDLLILMATVRVILFREGAR